MWAGENGMQGGGEGNRGHLNRTKQIPNHLSSILNRGASLIAPMVKKKISLPKQETWIWSLGQEDPLEKEMATHSSIFAWEVPWTEEPGGVQSMGSHELDMT